MRSHVRKIYLDLNSCKPDNKFVIDKARLILCLIVEAPVTNLMEIFSAASEMKRVEK
jgi:hypothetical protein